MILFFENLTSKGLILWLGSILPIIRQSNMKKMMIQEKLVLKPGKKRIIKNVYYKGNAKVNLAGYWKKGLSDLLWTITNMEPEKAIEFYLNRMKIEQNFKD